MSKMIDKVVKMTITAGSLDDRNKYGADKFIGEHIMFGNEQYPDWDSVLKKLI